ncbi:MAG: glycosyltransferase family 2 protein [Campylobacterales bacterium]|nr:glycosyltransferase family 2 protein [Campylobacterales bacterium]
MLSIIIPLYNKEKYIAQTLNCVINQTYKEFEVVIVDDGSTDKSLVEVASFKDDRIRVVNQKNSGVSSARNRGILESKSSFLLFLDADDLWENDFLESMIRLKNNYPHCSVFASNYKILNNKHQYQSLVIRGLPQDFHDGILNNYFDIASKSDPILWTSAIMVEKKAIESIGGFPIGIRAGEDLLTWARLAAKYDIVYSSQEKAIFNRVDEGLNIAPRIPDTHNKVGEGLYELLELKDTKRLQGLKQYIASWHKIRLAIFLRLGEALEAKKEFKYMTKFAKKDFKLFIYALLVFSPNFLKQSLHLVALKTNSLYKNYILSRKEKK